MGFLQGRSAVGNIHKVLTILDRVKSHLSRTEMPVLLTADAENAFDNVKWSWLNLVFDKIGLTGKFCTYLSDIYTNPTARVYTPWSFVPDFYSPKRYMTGMSIIASPVQPRAYHYWRDITL